MARAMCMTVALTLTAVVVQAQLPVGGSLVGENPSAMLTELEGMVRSGETPAFELITTIENLIQAEIMPGLGNTQDSAAQDTTAALSAIDTCNSQSKMKEGQIEGTEEVAVNNARSIHAACRESEKSLYDHNLTDPSSDCVKLGKFLHGATLLEIPAGIDRSWSVQYVKDNADKNMCGQSAVTELDNGCSAQESALAEEKAKCASNQGTFERAFCTWKTALESNCKQLETCHSQKVAAYDSHVTVRKALVEKWNVETGALQKILCYCKVWLSAKDERDQGDERSKHNATQFEVCTGQSYVPTDVNYGTPADKVPCLLTSVAEHPGTSGFITQEYSSFTDFFQPVDPCAEATTVAPTAGVPTTEAPTTGAPTTEAPTAEAPTTDAPTTEAPTTEAPTTEAPTTEAPTTEAPTTEAPTTEAPTTEACTNHMEALCTSCDISGAEDEVSPPTGWTLQRCKEECLQRSDCLGIDFGKNGRAGSCHVNKGNTRGNPHANFDGWVKKCQGAKAK